MRPQLEDSKAEGWNDLKTYLLPDLLVEVGCQLGASDLSMSSVCVDWFSHSMVAGFYKPAKSSIAYHCRAPEVMYFMHFIQQGGYKA